MKLPALLIMLCTSLSVFAQFHEVECSAHTANKDIKVEIERPFPSNAFTKDARVFITEDGRQIQHDYRVMTYQSRGFNSVRYEAGGMGLEIDFWPDQRPQWGRTYTGKLNHYDQRNNHYNNLRCRFPFGF